MKSGLQLIPSLPASPRRTRSPAVHTRMQCDHPVRSQQRERSAMVVAHTSPVVAPAASRRRSWKVAARGLGLLVGLAAILLVALLSIRVGSIGVSNRDVWNALVHYDS